MDPFNLCHAESPESILIWALFYFRNLFIMELCVSHMQIFSLILSISFFGDSVSNASNAKFLLELGPTFNHTKWHLFYLC